MLHQSLAPSAELSARVRCATGRFEEECEQEGVRVATRARALEVLRFDGQPAFVLPRLLDAVHGRVLEERRSAACALAELRGALDPLLTAHELEEDELTRGLLLLSVGEQGGERARSFLEERLERGRRSERPWAALALGILAGSEWDEEACRTLRAAHARAGKSERDAFVLALGLARDGGAHEVLVETLASSKSDRSRMFAAVALGLIGAEEGHAVLTSAIGELSCPYARSGVALALARYGDPGDVERLVGLLHAERRPESLRDLALALGLEAAPGTADALLALLEQDPPAAVRAAALDALGLALASDASLAAIELGQTSNYAAWPDWVQSLLQRPL
jgi:HEAT repeat protein